MVVFLGITILCSSGPQIEINTASRLGPPSPKPRQARWQWADIETFLKACGLEQLPARDLRRTAIVLMGEAGATEAQIAAVPGHSIESTRQILEAYLPRTLKMAREDIEKWGQSA